MITDTSGTIEEYGEPITYLSDRGCYEERRYLARSAYTGEEVIFPSLRSAKYWLGMIEDIVESRMKVRGLSREQAIKF